MGLRGLVILLLALSVFAPPLHAQIPVSEKLTLAAKTAATWNEGRATVVQLEGPAVIELDGARLTARQAVLWIEPVAPNDPSIQDVQIALIGDAKLTREGAERSGDRLFATARIRDKISVTADDRAPRDLSASDLYRQASALRAAHAAEADSTRVEIAVQPASVPSASTQATPPPAPKPGKGSNAPVLFDAENVETTESSDGTVAGVLTGGVSLIQRRPEGDLIELRAGRVVIFTRLKSLKELADPTHKKELRENVVGAYLEDDVRIVYTPTRKGMGEQRLNADKVYYDFGTDRAVLVNAVLHTNEPAHQTPFVARAKVLRQLSVGEYRADNMQITTSQFAVPSFSIAADRMYVREEPGDNPEAGGRVYYQARGVTSQLFNVPFFWWPYASGSLERGEAIRGIGVGNSQEFGFEFMSEWGLFETFGAKPPRDIDINYRLDYFTERGFGTGASGSYHGGRLTDTEKEPWDFRGNFTTYWVYDHGTDELGRLPARETVSAEPRGVAQWEHQHFFPNNWTAQLRFGYVSDATFMEQWFRRDFEQDLPHDISAYMKHQGETDTFSLGITYQPTKLVTTSNMVQEQFEVERLPQMRYDRIGDGLLGDNVTFFSQNSGAGLHYQLSRASLKDQGFAPPSITPGIAVQGTTGTTHDMVWRGDTRQELDFPFTVGPLRVMPYVFGRYTQYSDSPTGSETARFFAGTGMRLTTEIWKTDPTIRSELFDIHQLRHVIEPEINVFTSATNYDNTRVFIYDQDIDRINDVSAAQFALHQRWQTKRGGPGAWRSVDVFDLNVDVDFFANKPPRSVRDPVNFRGAFFPSTPEASIPRDAINADASWRISDNTLVLGDTTYNLDKNEVQTIGVGVLARRGDRLSAFVGNRYINNLRSNITSMSMNYELSTKYTLSFDQSFDFGQNHNVQSSIALVRRFDTFFVAGRYYVDEITGENGFSFNISPIGLGQGLDTGSFQTFKR